MAFELPALPSFQTNIPQQVAAQPSPMEQYGKMLQLRALSGQIQQQQQMQPLQLQQEQQQVQAATLANQEKQQEIEDRKGIIKAFGDPNFAKAFTGTPAADATGLGFDPVAMTHELATTYGVKNPQMILSTTQGFIDRASKIADIFKAQAEAGEASAAARAKGFDMLHGRIADVIADPTGAPQLLNDVINNPQIFSGVPKDDLQHVYSALAIGGTRSPKPTLSDEDIATLKAAGGGLQVDKKIWEAQTAQADAAKAKLGVAAPTAAQLSTFTTKTIPSFAALAPEQRQAFIAEAQNARTVDELNKVTERADATDKAEQMHRDSLAQTEALKGQTFAQQGLKENDKTWTDPQHGYLQTLAQANLGKAAIKAGADGNGLLTSLEPTMAVLGMNSFAGVHRVPPAEAAAAGAPGGWAERFTAWASKAATGKISDQVAKEGNQLFDQLIDSKYSTSLQASAMHAKGYNIPAANLSVMDRDGNLITLDKAPKVKGAAADGTAASGNDFFSKFGGKSR